MAHTTDAVLRALGVSYDRKSMDEAKQKANSEALKSRKAKSGRRVFRSQSARIPRSESPRDPRTLPVIEPHEIVKQATSAPNPGGIYTCTTETATPTRSISLRRSISLSHNQSHSNLGEISKKQTSESDGAFGGSVDKITGLESTEMSSKIESGQGAPPIDESWERELEIEIVESHEEPVVRSHSVDIGEALGGSHEVSKEDEDTVIKTHHFSL